MKWRKVLYELKWDEGEREVLYELKLDEGRRERGLELAEVG
jgi:hypothetical protein